jgi:type I restriction-modification system DNA methylase subunit
VTTFQVTCHPVRFASKENVPHFARSVAFEEITANDYNLSVSSYVEAKDTREKIDINPLLSLWNNLTNLPHYSQR